MQLLFYQEYDFLEPENKNRDIRTSDSKKYSFLLQVIEDILPSEKRMDTSKYYSISNLWEPKHKSKPLFQANY
jgi:hypothetical protein